MEDEIFDSIGQLIKTLQDVAIDERHTPRLYARFLSGLLMKHRRGGSGIAGRLQPHPPASELALRSQPHSYMGSRDPAGPQAHPNIQAQQGSESRHDNNTMQLKTNQLLNSIEMPASRETTVRQSDIASYTPGVLHDGSVSGTSRERDDVSMADVMGEAGALATMHALNEVWWGNMMMPGCVCFLFNAHRSFNSPIMQVFLAGCSAHG